MAKWFAVKLSELPRNERNTQLVSTFAHMHAGFHPLFLRSEPLEPGRLP